MYWKRRRMIDDFLQKETTCPTFVTDGKEKKGEYGCHYLNKKDVLCGHCKCFGVLTKQKGLISCRVIWEVHFGNHCCSKGNVKGIHDYDLPE